MKTYVMQSFVVIIVCISPWAVSASSRYHSSSAGRDFLSAGLHPEVVSNTLARVEDEWKSQAAAFAECKETQGSNTACMKPQQDFSKSCITVVDAIVKGSSGDQNRARTYMDVVCGQRSLVGWHHERCVDLGRAIDSALQFNEFANRMNFKSAQLCSGFWSSFASAEQKRAKEEREAQKQMLLRANERAKALAEKRQQEEAHRQALDSQQRTLEAKEKVAKAKREAEEHLREIARKKAEAEVAAAAAQQKVTQAAHEAAKAAEEHRQKLAEHKKAEEHLRNITAVHGKAIVAATRPQINMSSREVHNSTDHPSSPIVVAVFNVTKAPTNMTVANVTVATVAKQK